MKPALEALNKKPNISTVLENIKVLAELIILQETRTPTFRQSHDDMVRLTNERLKGENPFFQEPTENDTKEFQARFLDDVSDSFTDVLLNMKWILISNQTNHPFWISDNPIFRYNPRKSDLIGNLGLKSPGIQVHFPISPTGAISVCDPFDYSAVDSELEAFIDHVQFNNSGQVINSERYLFSSNEDFSMAKEMIRRDPNLANPKRPRITMGN